MASTSSHATITSEATAPAVILAFSFRVVGRSMSYDIGRSVFGWRQPSVGLRPCSFKTRGGPGGKAWRAEEFKTPKIRAAKG
jgi:hypothetical protein